MATLTQTAYFSRKVIKYGIIAFIALIFLRFAYITVKRLIPPKPKPLPPPNIAFGKLPKLLFPEDNRLLKINYKLDTISGTLPKLPEQAKVFFIPKPGSNLLAWDKTKAWAKTLGFINEPEEISEFDYRFIANGSPKTTIEVNVNSKNFRFYYDWKNDLGSTTQQSPPTVEQSTSIAGSFLQTAESLTEDIDLSATKVVFLKNESGSLIEAPFPEANFSRVNFFRKPIDEIKILPPNPKDSNISLIVSFLKNNYQGVIEAKYIYNLVYQENFATYPIKNAEQAWTEIINGKGYVANLGNNPEGNIVIRNAYLAYYDSEKPQNFLQPIIVFEGDRDFSAFVPAITDNLILE